MFGFAFAAACMPAYDVWLNDLSSIPPVSSTMQASRVLPLACVVDDDCTDDDEVPPPGCGWLLLEVVDEPDLLPQAASATAATTAHDAASPVLTGRNTMILSTHDCLTARRYSSTRPRAQPLSGVAPVLDSIVADRIVRNRADDRFR